MSKLLINEQPLQVIPSLAVAIGLNEAIFVQQLHYFLNISKHKYEERIWIYNTIDEWCEIFPFWSKKTIQRTIKRLEEMGLILSTNKLNKMKMDKTKWYSIAYEKIEELTSQNDQMRCDQNGSSMRSKWDDRYSQNDQMSCGHFDHTNNQRKDFYTEENTPLPPKGESANADDVPVAENKKQRSLNIDYVGIGKAYNQCVAETGKNLPSLADPENLSQARKRKIKILAAVMKKRFGSCDAETFRNYFLDFMKSARSFYFGENDRGWRADFEYILSEKIMDKTIEGSL
ncbi:DNA replication protein [Pasteurella multocida subsp. multocida]|uniref:DNA replication protein n=1 Tax=Pasteurella multocida TaxID=747 RepID=UPI00223650E7|nr:DNA replication protein [Pasteurella multocida]MCW4596802.1 DNA replication protein [Pasteurella multocida subsp. multocida]